MRLEAVFVLGLLAFALPGDAFGQTSLPWAKPGQPKAPATEEVLESQLPLARARIEGSGAAWVGQAVALRVEVIVPTWFTGAPRFPEIEVLNAVTLSPEGAVNFVVQSAGKTFSAQGQRYLIFPQARGKYTVPSATVEVTYALPDGKPSPPRLIASSPVPFEARMPAGAEGAKYFLTADNLQVNQALDRKLEGLKVGDSIIRTVGMTAENTVGMTLPALGFEAPEGIRVYPGTPKVSEKAERGKVEATRTETATYILEKEGRYRLPEMTILWWEPQKERMNKARVSAVEFQVEGDAGLNPEAFVSSEEVEKDTADEPKRTVLGRLRPSLRGMLGLLGVLLFLLVLRRLLSLKGVSIRSYLADRKRQRAEAERTYFKRFRKASLSNDARATLRELMFWLDRTNARAATFTLKRFAEESRIPELFKATNELNEVLFAGLMETGRVEAEREWSGRRFSKLVAKARRAQIRRNKKPGRRGEQVLSLNPREAAHG